jgi:serine/threonine protein kinase
MISHENSIINGKYIIIERIGAGSFGVIYKGKNIFFSIIVKRILIIQYL